MRAEPAIVMAPPCGSGIPWNAPGRHVLLVVPEQRARYALADALLDADFSLTLAASGHVAAMLLGSGAEFDALVTEHGPALDGRDLARRAQAVHPDLPVLLLAGECAHASAGVPGAVERLLAEFGQPATARPGLSPTR